MSTPTSHRSGRSATEPSSESRPSPQESRTPTTQRPSFAVEPKSEYLRSALQARRAKDTPSTPSSAEPRTIPPQRRPSTTSRIVSPVGSSSDPWLDQVHSEDGTPHTPVRRARRPSEGAIPRPPTQREQKANIEAMRTKMFNMSLQNELLKKQNNELKDQLEEAKQRVEDLEPLEEQNVDLRDENNSLKLKMQGMEEELEDLDAQNREILQIQEDVMENMEKQRIALEEAADMVVQLEEDKGALQEEISRLKAQLATNRPQEFYRGALDGQAQEKHPSRVHSIDESRPSTSHFDSDYYSQPESPQVKSQVENHSSIEGLSFRDRAKGLAAKTLNSQNSLKDINKRLSSTSMKQLQSRGSASVSVVPPVPESSLEAHWNAVQSQPVARTTSRQHTRTMQQNGSRNITPVSATASEAKDGLRGVYHDNRPMEIPFRSSPGFQSPTSSRGPRYPEFPSLETVSAPRRESSTPARNNPEQERASSHGSYSLTETYAESMPPPPSMISEDLTSRPDPEKWWKDVHNVRSVAERDINTAPPFVMERNFLFNDAEDEEQFMRKAKGYMPRRK